MYKDKLSALYFLKIIFTTSFLYEFTLFSCAVIFGIENWIQRVIYMRDIILNEPIFKAIIKCIKWNVSFYTKMRLIINTYNIDIYFEIVRYGMLRILWIFRTLIDLIPFDIVIFVAIYVTLMAAYMTSK